MLRAKLKESVGQARNSMKGAATMGDNQSTQSLVIEPIPQTTSKGAGLAEIVVFTDGRKEASRILEFAGLLAEENRARLIELANPGLSPISWRQFDCAIVVRPHGIAATFDPFIRS